MDRGLRWLFWGFLISCLWSDRGLGHAVGTIVVMYGMALVGRARPDVSDFDLRRSQGVNAMLLVVGIVHTSVPLFRAIFVIISLFLQLARGEWLFLYLAESEALYGKDTTALHMQRITMRKLYAAQIVLMAVYSIGLLGSRWVSEGMLGFFFLLPVFSGIMVLLALGTNIYQAWRMAQLRKA